MTEGAIDAESIGGIHHQAIGPFRLLDGLTTRRLPRWQGIQGNDVDIVVLQEKGRQRIIGQGGIGHRRRADVLARGHIHIRMSGTGIRGPDIGRNGLAPMAGIASDPGIGDMGLPGRIGIQGHPEHVPGDELGVLVVQGTIFRGVAVITSFRLGQIGGHPLGDGQHEPVELGDTQVAKHLDVLVNLRRLGGYDRRGRLRRGWNILLHLGRQNPGIDHRLHTQAVIAQLHRLLRRPLAASQTHEGGGYGERQGLARKVCSVHCAPPGSKEGSGKACGTSG